MLRMRTIFLSVVILLGSFSYSEAKHSDKALDAFNNLDWGIGLSQAFERANIEEKNVIVLVEDVKCKWCIKMKKGALSDTRVQEILKEYILVKVLRANKVESNQLKGFDGTIPNLYFMTKEKEIVDTITGYFTVDDFLGYLKEIQADGF
ncbi:MAG TPA: DUF255 domain-containing protein [Sulfurovum sp.]|nr:DUF255 domain-containing protein [Sulfurovum sp.]